MSLIPAQHTGSESPRPLHTARFNIFWDISRTAPIQGLFAAVYFRPNEDRTCLKSSSASNAPTNGPIAYT